MAPVTRVYQSLLRSGCAAHISPLGPLMQLLYRNDRCAVWVQEAQLAFSAVEFALRQHQPCSPQEGGDAIMESLLDGLADEHKVCC